MLVGYVVGTGTDAAVVVPVVRVFDAPVIADRRPALIHEGGSSHRCSSRPVVEKDACKRGLEPAVLDNVVDVELSDLWTELGPTPAILAAVTEAGP